MVMRRLIYEGDSLIHRAPRGVDPAAASSDAAEADRPEPIPTVASRCSEAMRGFFPQLSVWLSSRVHFSRLREIEAYLAQATDLADLEHRIGRLERGAHWH